MNLAQRIVKALAVGQKDNVTIYFYPHTLKLAEETAEECFRKGADVLLNLYTDEYYEAYLTHLNEESLRQPSDFCRSLAETSTVEILLGGVYDPSFFRQIPTSKLAASAVGESKAHLPPRRRRTIKQASVHLGAVTRPRAKVAGYNYGKWRRMVEQASLIDPAILSKRGRKLSSILSDAKRVVIADQKGTNLKLNLKGRSPFMDDGIIDRTDLRQGFTDIEIPAGSVTVVPDEDSAEGRIVFGLPVLWRGRTIRRLEWTFRDGRVVDFRGDQGAMSLRQSWIEAAGDKDRIASFTIGINPKAKLGFSLNPISAGAVSIAIGGNQDLKGRNKSSFYFQGTIERADLIADGQMLVKAGKINQ